MIFKEVVNIIKNSNIGKIISRGKAIDFHMDLCMMKKNLSNWNDAKGGNTEFNLQFWLNVQGIKVFRIQLSCKNEKEE